MFDWLNHPERLSLEPTVFLRLLNDPERCKLQVISEIEHIHQNPYLAVIYCALLMDDGLKVGSSNLDVQIGWREANLNIHLKFTLISLIESLELHWPALKF